MSLSSIQRRDVLKLGAAAALSPWGLSSGPARAAPLVDYRALVCVFLYGGNDGNNLLVPTDTTRYNQYQSARPELAVPRETLLPITPLGGGDAYGLHPALAPVKTLFDAGVASVVANVGPLRVPTTLTDWEQRRVPLPVNLFSHVDQQGAWLSAAYEGGSPQHGWAGRMLERLVAPSTRNRGYAGIGLSTGNVWQIGDQGLLPSRISPSGDFGFDFYDPNNLADPLSAAISSLLGQTQNDPFGQTWLTTLTRSIDNQRILTAALAGATLTTEFPATNLGTQLQMAARLIKARDALGLRRQCFFCSMGGLDTHGEDQLLTQESVFGELAEAMAAFHAATVEIGLEREVTLFTASDFGRTLASNGVGTDHGWGSHHLVVGGSVAGGQLVGRFPELVIGGPDDTGSGVWIPTTAVDQVGNELGRWFGASEDQLDEIFPQRGEFDLNLGLMRST